MKQNIFFFQVLIFFTQFVAFIMPTQFRQISSTPARQRQLHYLFIFIYKPVHYLSYIFITLCTSLKLYNTNI